MKRAVILIGHGGIPTDFPSEKVGRLKMLEAQRIRSGTPMSHEEHLLDHEIRNWPRTRLNDPFCFGIQAIAKSLVSKLANTKLMIAYNEFCGPSIEQAAQDLVQEGYEHITLLTTMFTPGGLHSEIEIPQIVKKLRQKYAKVRIEYPWPFDLNQVAGFLAAQL